jgi:hypothetical protein
LCACVKGAVGATWCLCSIEFAFLKSVIKAFVLPQLFDDIFLITNASARDECLVFGGAALVLFG